MLLEDQTLNELFSVGTSQILFLSFILILAVLGTVLALAATRSSSSKVLCSAITVLVLFFVASGIFIGLEVNPVFSAVTLLPVVIIILYIVIARKSS
jgi:CHASE2 domain-containing sensor protein